MDGCKAEELLVCTVNQQTLVAKTTMIQTEHVAPAIEVMHQPEGQGMVEARIGVAYTSQSLEEAEMDTGMEAVVMTMAGLEADKLEVATWVDRGATATTGVRMVPTFRENSHQVGFSIMPFSLSCIITFVKLCLFVNSLIQVFAY